MSNTLLKKLINNCNKPQKLTLRQLFKITQKKYAFYFSLPISKRLKCHEELELLSAKTALIRANYAPSAFGEEKILESIELMDVRQLCNYLELPIHSDTIDIAVSSIENVKSSCPLWLCESLTEMQNGWKEGKKPFHCSPEELDKIQDVCCFLTWIETTNISELVSLDIRTVSVRLFNDSKRLESLASKIKSLIKNQLPEEVQNLSPIEVLAYIGVSRFPPLFRFKGELTIGFKKGSIDTVHCWPNIGVSPDGIVSITIKKPPKYVLFIENQTTFERYCREVDDHSLIFYTNGFPSRAWQTLYRKIEGLLPAKTQFFHWGDIDVGGYQILSFMDNLFERPITPYMMNPIDIIATSEKLICASNLVQCIDNAKSEPIQELKTSLLALGEVDIPWLEQESLGITAIKINDVD